MRLLRRHKHFVLIIGMGVVGNAAFEQLYGRFNTVAGAQLDWFSLTECQILLSDFVAKNLPKNSEQIDVIWCAGKTGFCASWDEAARDLEFFKIFVGHLAKSVRIRVCEAKLRFVLISSAGGLFEGQTCISRTAKPKPLRPYGHLKLAQEDYVKSHKLLDEFALLRLSSVYSISNLRSRMGFISTLVSKAIRQEFMPIYGTEMTLRDYVLDEDIGRYILDMLEEPLPGMVFVIDGKPYSIAEIKNMLESISGKKVYLNYALTKSNAANMSFSQNIRAKGFNPSNLATNLRLLHHNLLSGATL